MNPDRHPSFEPAPPGAAQNAAEDGLATLGPAETSFVCGGGDPLGPLPRRFGRYVVIRKLGQGAMGAVYFAHDTQLDRDVALKVPRFSLEDGPRVLERFRLEACAAATFHHPNLCPIYDVGQVGATHYLTMAYLEGTPLANRLASGPPMTQRESARLVQQIAIALAYAHRHGVLHRDLKPANIMLQGGDVPVVMDFGLARRDRPDAYEQDTHRLTRIGEIVGTPAYMSPEQVEGNAGAMGPGCDIYSLGVILYELLTGQLPFRGSMPIVLAQILTKEPEPPKTLRPDIDPALGAICMKALAKKSADRFADADEMAAALAGYLQQASPAVPAPSTRASSGRRGWRFAATALAVLAAGAVAAGVVLTIVTDHGTVKIELSDPAAHVEVKIDRSIEIAGIGEPIRLRTGEHGLIVTGKDYETASQSFTILRGKETVVQVSLTPLPKIAAIIDSPPETPPEKTVGPVEKPIEKAAPKAIEKPAETPPVSLGPSRRVLDDIGYFSDAAKTKANLKIAEIKRLHKRDLVVEAVSAPKLPANLDTTDKKAVGDYYTRWALDRATDLAVRGVYVVVVPSAKRFRVEVSRRTQADGIFLNSDARELTTKISGPLAKHPDEALEEIVTFVWMRMAENQATNPSSP
jgi:hypothetical protein